MPTEARWFVKTSLACLLLSSLSGTLYFGWGALFDDVAPAWLRPLHIHLATVGWLVNMVFGVALWMFPMPKGAAGDTRKRYPRGRVVAAFLALNAGLALRFVAEPLGSPAVGLASGLLQTAGIVLVLSVLWPRVRSILPPTPSAASTGALP